MNKRHLLVPALMLSIAACTPHSGPRPVTKGEPGATSAQARESEKSELQQLRDSVVGKYTEFRDLPPSYQALLAGGTVAGVAATSYATVKTVQHWDEIVDAAKKLPSNAKALGKRTGARTVDIYNAAIRQLIAGKDAVPEIPRNVINLIIRGNLKGLQAARNAWAPINNGGTFVARKTVDGITAAMIAAHVKASPDILREIEAFGGELADNKTGIDELDIAISRGGLEALKVLAEIPKFAKKMKSNEAAVAMMGARDIETNVKFDMLNLAGIDVTKVKLEGGANLSWTAAMSGDTLAMERLAAVGVKSDGTATRNGFTLLMMLAKFDSPNQENVANFVLENASKDYAQTKTRITEIDAQAFVDAEQVEGQPVDPIREIIVKAKGSDELTPKQRELVERQNAERNKSPEKIKE